MGNNPKPKPNWHQVTPRPILNPEPHGGGGPVVDELPLPTWLTLLEDLTPAAERLRAGVAVRGEQAEPRVRAYAGRHLIGFVPVRESAEIREAMHQGRTGLLGQVASVDLSTRRVVVKLRLEGR
jgi:hypothetical protein